MWAQEVSLRARASAEALWVRWADPSCWPQDDPDTSAASFDGELAVGTRGSVAPRRGPRSRLVVTRVEEPRGLDFETPFPGAVMSFQHELADLDHGEVELPHRVQFTGPLAPLWGRLVGRSIAGELGQVMRRVVGHAGGEVLTR